MDKHFKESFEKSASIKKKLKKSLKWVTAPIRKKKLADKLDSSVGDIGEKFLVRPGEAKKYFRRSWKANQLRGKLPKNRGKGVGGE